MCRGFLRSICLILANKHVIQRIDNNPHDQLFQDVFKRPPISISPDGELHAIKPYCEGRGEVRGAASMLRCGGGVLAAPRSQKPPNQNAW